MVHDTPVSQVVAQVSHLKKTSPTKKHFVDLRTMAHFGKPEYWNMRYSATSTVEPFHEWYQNYGRLRHFLTHEFLALGVSTNKTTIQSTHLCNNLTLDDATTGNNHLLPSTPFPDRSSCRTLILGCGNSRFAEDMLRDGWTGGIVNVDFSNVVIDQMKTAYNKAFYEQLGIGICNKEKKPYMEFVCADITQGLGMYRDGSFDLIVCKATLDAILSSAGSTANAKQVIQDCHRLLASNHGVFLLVTFGNPDSRVAFLEHNGELSYFWHGVSVNVVTRARSNPQEPVKKDYVYICRKRGSAQKEMIYSTQFLTKTNDPNHEEAENRPVTATTKNAFTNKRM